MATSLTSPSAATSAPTTSLSTVPAQTSVSVPTEPTTTTTEEPSTTTATASSSTEHDRDRRAPTSSTDGAGTLKVTTQSTTKPPTSTSANTSPATGTKRGKKPGILRKLKSVLLSCVGPSGAHETGPGKEELGAGATAAPSAEAKKAGTNEKVKDFATEPVSAAAGTSEKPDTSLEQRPATTHAEPGSSASAGPTNLQAPQSLEVGAEAVTSPSASAIPNQLSIPPTTADTEEPVVITPVALLPQDETAGVTSGAVVPPGAGAADISAHTATSSGVEDEDESVGSVGTTGDGDETGEELDLDQEAEDDEDRLIAQGGAGIPIGPDGVPRPLLPPIALQHSGRKCLVLDLDETLVHSSFKSIAQADYVVPVEIEYNWHNVYVIKRPGVDQFLKKMGEIYEIVVYTASLSKYADPVLDKLDIHHVVSHRLFREHCYNHRGTSYVKDLSQLGRTIGDTIILDNSPASYIFHPNNAVPVSSWFNDPHDTELTDMVPFLADLAGVQDVRGVLDGGL